MNYNIDEIKLYMENFGVNDDGFFTADDVDFFICEISKYAPSFDWDTGATKLVIMPENRDYVIKIPFNGEWVCGECRHFYNADSEFGDNYCEDEITKYAEAVDAGFAEMFLPIECVMEIDSIPIYVQQKAEMLDCDGDMEQKEYSSKASRDKIVEKYNEGKRYLSRLPLSWIASCLDVLGSIERVEEFMKFLDEFSISYDLHRANVGYYNHKAVIIDYGGYGEQGEESEDDEYVSC